MTEDDQEKTEKIFEDTPEKTSMSEILFGKSPRKSFESNSGIIKFRRYKDNKDHLRDFFFVLRELVQYWHKVPHRSEVEKMEGLVHSMLVILDGMSGSLDILPVDLTIKNQSGQREIINEGVMLQEMWYK